MKAWDGAGLVEAEMGLDWRGECGWTPEFEDDKLFRAVEYGAMWVAGSWVVEGLRLTRRSQGGVWVMRTAAERTEKRRMQARHTKWL